MAENILKRGVSRRAFLKGAMVTGIAAALGDELFGGPLSTLLHGPTVAQAAGDEKEYFAYCPAMALCTAVCPLKVTVKDGRITHITNQPKYLSCVIGHSQRMSVYDPSRLKYPMKRVGQRGEGKFQRITWDEAIDTYANKIKEIAGKYGNQSIMFYPARGTEGLARLAPRVKFPEKGDTSHSEKGDTSHLSIYSFSRGLPLARKVKFRPNFMERDLQNLPSPKGLPNLVFLRISSCNLRSTTPFIKAR